MLDVLIANGLIVDGTGSAGFYGAVGVEGDTVRILRGDVSSVQAARTIDATGHVVCPGFIDVHAHSALMILAHPEHEPKVRQGVTTELHGIDGNSYAPFFDPKDFDRFYQLNSGLEGAPELPGRWSTVAEYLDMYHRKVAVNVCYIVGNSPLRIATVGWDDRPPTEKDLANMKSLLREALEEGAFGMSTGLDYPPGNYADTDELVELSKVGAALGGIYHSHVRYSLGDRFLDPFREAIEIGRRIGIPAHITHFYQRVGAPGGADEMLALVEGARLEGLDVTFDSYPYIYSSTRLLIIFPDWAHDGGPKRLKEALDSPDGRERLRKEVRPRALGWDEMWLTYFKRPQNHQYEGRTIAQVAEMRDQHPVDALCDLLLEEDLQTCYISAGGNAKTLPKFVSHPLSMVGSDAVLLGDFPSPRTYGCFPIILSEFVREENYLSLPDAIRKMTLLPAQRLERVAPAMKRKGRVQVGADADLTVFDPARVIDNATFENPVQVSRGIVHVLVNGTPVVRDERRVEGVAPGRAVRGERR